MLKAEGNADGVAVEMQGMGFDLIHEWFWITENLISRLYEGKDSHKMVDTTFKMMFALAMDHAKEEPEEEEPNRRTWIDDMMTSSMEDLENLCNIRA